MPNPCFKEQGQSTLTRPVSGEQQNFSQNLKILPGIETFSGKNKIIKAGKMQEKIYRTQFIFGY